VSDVPRPDTQTASARSWPPVGRALVITHGNAAVIGDGLARLDRLAREHGVEILFPAAEGAKHDLGVLRCAWRQDDGGDVDLCVALGGDGTTLRALHLARERAIPVFAVNYGHLGFLTAAPAADLEPALGRAFAGERQVVELPTLAAWRDGRIVGRAVNDVVITGMAHGHAADLQWEAEGVALARIRCDAIVVATPAGSTAYSLSAGGPVLGWGLDALCVTFVAPHSLAVRSFVLPAGSPIAVENARDDAPVQLVIDGQAVDRPIVCGEKVSIGLAAERARLALLPETRVLERFKEAFASFP
jgi:NAD+ kinase